MSRSAVRVRSSALCREAICRKTGWPIEPPAMYRILIGTILISRRRIRVALFAMPAVPCRLSVGTLHVHFAEGRPVRARSTWPL
jgi:hypothetical protein